MKKLNVSIIEMNAVGSMTKGDLENANKTQWKVSPADDPK